MLGYLSLVICAAVLVFAVLQLRLRLKLKAREQPSSSYSVVLASLWLLVPPVAAFVVSQVATAHLYLDRYFIICLPAAAVLLALGLDRLKGLWLGTGAVLVLVGLRASVIPSTYAVPDQLQRAAAYLLSSTREGDCITFNIPQGHTSSGIASEIADYHADHARDGPLPMPVLPSFSWASALRPTFVEPSSRQTLVSVQGSCRRLWIALEPSAPGQNFVVDGTLGWLHNHGWARLSSKSFPGMQLLLVGSRSREPAQGGA
ncbi:MAG: hypothetical protein ACRDZP_01565 [Acidimicrobiales bacterium]